MIRHVESFCCFDLGHVVDMIVIPVAVSVVVQSDDLTTAVRYWAVIVYISRATKQSIKQGR